MNGKGSDTRRTDLARYERNDAVINWPGRKRKEAAKSSHNDSIKRNQKRAGVQL